MFKVIDKREEYHNEPTTISTVYGVLEDSSGYPKFLFYEFGQWVYHSAKNFVPYKGNRE